MVAGFRLWEVKNMAEAVEWVKRCPNPMLGPSEIEIRPVFEAADFGDALTPELAEQEGGSARRRPNAEACQPPPSIAATDCLAPRFSLKRDTWRRSNPSGD